MVTIVNVTDQTHIHICLLKHVAYHGVKSHHASFFIECLNDVSTKSLYQWYQAYMQNLIHILLLWKGISDQVTLSCRPLDVSVVGADSWLWRPWAMLEYMDLKLWRLAEM